MTRARFLEPAESELEEAIAYFNGQVEGHSSFQDTTLRAFHRLVFDEVPAPRVAEELGISVGAVYVAKSRVLRALMAV